jgi:RimJ/RimL family protein N-acetyltransferase
MNLIGERIIIRNFEQNDFDSFYELIKDPKNHETAGLEYSLDKNKSKDIFDKYLVLANSYVIALKSNQKMVGIIELNERGISNGLDKTREIGFVISTQYRNQGYATEAIKMMLEYSFEELKLTEVWASVKVNNSLPQDILTKFGFKYIYQVSQDPLHLESEADTIKYYLLKNEEQGNY